MAAEEEHLLACLRAGKWPRVVLDFDDTVFLDNSTERFLDNARPRLLTFLVVLCSDRLVGLSGRMGLCAPRHWCDYIRVVAVSLLMPWAWLWWRLTAKRRMRCGMNRALVEAVAAGRPAEVIVVSFGMRHVIHPMLAALPFDVTLAACRMGVPPDNLRVRGKVAALQEILPSDAAGEAVYVTDSLEEQAVAACVSAAYTVQWAPYKPRAFARLYVPMRYAVAGKYAGKNYLWNQIIQEDLLVVLLAYAFAPAYAAALALLFLSLYAIYERGYYHNDFAAAPREERPTRNERAVFFEDYPINWAWIWAGVFGVGGVAMLHLGGAFDPAVFLRDVVLWGGMLLVLQALFSAFNAMAPRRRIAVFPLLHGMKTFTFAVVIPLTLLGALLLLAQVACQSVNYVIYRRGGNWERFNPHIFRLLFFAALLIPASVLHPALPEGLLGWRGMLICAWMALRIAERASGTGLRRVLLGLVRREH
ncbi:MAG: HAD family hydrolase [Candidatus Hydrogenedentota bacterium]